MKNKTTAQKIAPGSVSDRFALYRWRYILAAIFMISLAINLIILTLIYTPAGLRQAEVSQVAKLDFQQSFSSPEIVNFPYKLLQILSIKFLGLTILSIKLPSLLLGAMIAVGIFWLISRWINRKIAIVTLILLISNSHFMFLAQDGTANIMLLFWQVVIMILLTKIGQLLPTAHQLKSPKITSNLALLFPLLLVVVSLSLYTPLALFLPLVVIVSVFAHPKLRLYLSCIKFKLLLPGIIASAIIISPLLLQALQTPKILAQLCGANFANSSWYQPLVDIIDFWSSSPQPFVQPVFTLGAFIIILIGLYSILKQSFSARSLIILLFLSLSLIATVISQDPSIIMILPLTILLGYGLHNLTLSWMSIFPLNPYPRFIGALILSATVITLVLANTGNLLKLYAYTPSIANQFNQDLTILRDFLPTDKTVLLVAEDGDELNFYRKLANDNLTVVTESDSEETDLTIYTNKAYHKLNMIAPTQILTDSASHNFDRFYIYQKNTK